VSKNLWVNTVYICIGRRWMLHFMAWKRDTPLYICSSKIDRYKSNIAQGGTTTEFMEDPSIGSNTH